MEGRAGMCSGQHTPSQVTPAVHVWLHRSTFYQSVGMHRAFLPFRSDALLLLPPKMLLLMPLSLPRAHRRHPATYSSIFRHESPFLDTFSQSLTIDFLQLSHCLIQSILSHQPSTSQFLSAKALLAPPHPPGHVAIDIAGKNSSRQGALSCVSGGADGGASQRCVWHVAATHCVIGAGVFRWSVDVMEGR